MDRDQALLASLDLVGPALAVPPAEWGRRYLVAEELRLVDGPADADWVDPDAYPRLEYHAASPAPVLDSGLSSSPPEGPRAGPREQAEAEPGVANDATPCLSEFMRLDDGEEDGVPQRVLDFARRWGPLGICRHRVLASHDLFCFELGRFGHPPDGVPAAPWEPVEPWRRYVRHLRGLMNVAVRLREGRPGNPRDWAAVAALNPERDDLLIDSPPLDEQTAARAAITARHRWAPSRLGDVAVERMVFGEAVQEWLRLGEVRVHAFWAPEEPAPRTELAYGTLRGVLAVQLAAAVLSRQGMYLCAGCGHPFTPPAGQRRPARDRRAWCPDCGRHAQWREYQRRRYESAKAQR